MPRSRVHVSEETEEPVPGRKGARPADMPRRGDGASEKRTDFVDDGRPGDSAGNWRPPSAKSFGSTPDGRGLGGDAKSLASTADGRFWDGGFFGGESSEKRTLLGRACAVTKRRDAAFSLRNFAHWRVVCYRAGPRLGRRRQERADAAR